MNDQTNVNEIIKSWVNLYSDSLYSWALYKTSEKEISEDLVQETFLAAFQSYTHFEGKSSPKTWLFSILNNKIIDYHRKRIKNPTIREQEQSEKGEYSLFNTMFDSNGMWKKEQMPQKWQLNNEPDNILDSLDFQKIMQLCMEKLPSKWFSAIQLKYLEDKNGDTICQELEITHTNYWQILHRAKLQLRKCLEINWFKN